MASGEANFRFNTTKYFDWIVGVRYIDYQESLSMLIDDDSLSTGVINPQTVATYSTGVHNRLLGFQFGCEAEWCLISRVAFGGFAKGIWGANFADIDINLTRLDGFQGPGAHISKTIFSQAYEVGLFADLLITEQWKLRVGYEGLFLCDVPLAVQQINFDLGNPRGHFNDNGSVFFHGPIVEVQFVF
jgi:hypothetical protein